MITNTYQYIDTIQSYTFNTYHSCTNHIHNTYTYNIIDTSINHIHTYYIHHWYIHTQYIHIHAFILYTYTYNRRTHRHMSIHIHTWYIIHTYIYILILYQCNRYIHITHITSLIHVYTHTPTHTHIRLYTQYMHTVHTYTYIVCTYIHMVYADPCSYSLQYTHMYIVDSIPLYMHMLI